MRVSPCRQEGRRAGGHEDLKACMEEGDVIGDRETLLRRASGPPCVSSIFLQSFFWPPLPVMKSRKARLALER
jgi:hypothetical protein